MKLKNIKMFEEVLNEAKVTPASIVEEIYNTANFLNYLNDEGYLDDDMQPKDGMSAKDINAALSSGDQFEDETYNGKELASLVKAAVILRALCKIA